MIFAPSFILVFGSVTEGAENTFQVMLVLKPYVLLHDRDSSRIWDTCSEFRQDGYGLTSRTSRGFRSIEIGVLSAVR